MDQNAFFNLVKEGVVALGRIADALDRRPNNRVVIVPVPASFNPESGRQLAKFIAEAINEDITPATSSVE